MKRGVEKKRGIVGSMIELHSFSEEGGAHSHLESVASGFWDLFTYDGLG